jgi:hypothetical protein
VRYPSNGLGPVMLHGQAYEVLRGGRLSDRGRGDGAIGPVASMGCLGIHEVSSHPWGIESCTGCRTPRAMAWGTCYRMGYPAAVDRRTFDDAMG